jgi:hypothetical protein
MRAYDINKPPQAHIDFFDLACQITMSFENKPLNAFDSIDAILPESEQPWEKYF